VILSGLYSEPPPTEDEFLAAVHYVLLYAGQAAKMLKRGELWSAKVACDCRLKEQLLSMLEWHARATHGPDCDTWYGGRFLEDWADSRAVAALPHTFAAYSADDLRRALFVTLDLFRWLAVETAERLGYAYPAMADQRVTEWLRSLFEGV
jgi:aminoglycoside 6-adenylyltransferase